ncbi:MAG: adenylosuccinate synthetase, partial [Myxococcales bacterium]|nr:adenylosuccinate synthetase [Myxococcales bacterium]
MSNVVIVGAQWGDEGKGKIIDQMAGKARYVVRFQGGNNAGHTVVVGEEKFVLHHLPCGALHRHVTSVIGPGVVIDPAVLLDEIDRLAERGVILEPERLRISDLCNVIMPYHRT